MKYKKLIIAALTILFLALAIAIGTYLVQQKQRAESEAAKPGSLTLPSLTLTSANSRPAVGSTFSVTVSIDAKGNSVNGTDLKINFDPAKLEAQSVVGLTDFLPSTIIDGNIENGKASIVLACLPTSGAICPKTGTGNLAQITFLVKGAGKTKVTFDPATAVSVKGFTKNSVGKLNSLQVTLSK